VLVVYVLIMLVGAATVARSLARSQDHTVASCWCKPGTCASSSSA
jgi:hypothetical protein